MEELWQTFKTIIIHSAKQAREISSKTDLKKHTAW